MSRDRDEGASWPLLALDAGNSSVKGAVFLGPRRRGSVFRVETGDVARFVREFERKLRSLRPRPSRALVASVRPDIEGALARAVARALDVEARFVGRDVPAPLDVRVREPLRVGADRLVDAAAALDRLRRKGDAVVVDCGSAITCDAVTATGEFLGGAIAPGLVLAARALADHTAALPLVAVSVANARARAIGRDTREAIRAGLVVGLRGLVAGLAAAARRELGARRRRRRAARAVVVATGGDARLLAPEGALVVPDLALRGVALAHDAFESRARGR